MSEDHGFKPTPLIDLLTMSDTAAIAAHLSDGVRFRSPYADYHGRATVAHLLALIGQVLSDVAPTRRVLDGNHTLTVLEAGVGKDRVQGVLYEEHDNAGRLLDAMLLLRPYRGLRAAMNAMAELLKASPLPAAA